MGLERLVEVIEIVSVMKRGATSEHTDDTQPMAHILKLLDELLLDILKLSSYFASMCAGLTCSRIDNLRFFINRPVYIKEVCKDIPINDSRI